MDDSRNFNSFMRALDLLDEFWPLSKSRTEAWGLLTERELCGWLQAHMKMIDQTEWENFLSEYNVNGDTSEKRYTSHTD